MPQQAAGRDVAAGWMKDPSGRHFGRYWDGEQWTDHVISAETVPGIDPVKGPNGEPDRIPGQGSRTEPASIPERPGSWRNDPSGRHASRYWDGGRWTEHVMSAERVPSVDPLPPRPVEPPRTEPPRTRVAPAAAPTKVGPASPGAEPLGSPQPRPLPGRAWEGVRAWTRSAPWAVVVIVCGLIIIGVALNGSSPPPTKGATEVTSPVATTAPSAAAPLVTTIPANAQSPVTVPGASADPGPPATTAVTTPATAPGSQSPVTSSPSVDSPATVPHPGQSTADPSMSTTS